jgi:hypothetical protein
MTEMVLPDVYIDVRAEGLIVPGRITVGNLGVVGTASKGPIGTPVLLGSYAEAQERFGDYDAWPARPTDQQTALTLVRALQLAFANGATTVFGVRVAGRKSGDPTTSAAKRAAHVLKAGTDDCLRLLASSEGTWGDDVTVKVEQATESPEVAEEEHLGSEGQVITLKHRPVRSARNRFRHFVNAQGVSRLLEAAPDPANLKPGQYLIATDGKLHIGDALAADDKIIASYLVDPAQAVKVSAVYGRTTETYTVLTGEDLALRLNDPIQPSALLQAEFPPESPASFHPEKKPDEVIAQLTGGDNGASAGAGDYSAGLDQLTNQPAHIIVGAGQDDTFGDELANHCQNASTDAVKRDRIAVVGSRISASVDVLRGNQLSSDRLIFVAPGIRATDTAASPQVEVVLPGSYTAAAVAGLLARLPAHVSPTNKTLGIGALEQQFTAAELTQLVLSHIFVLERRQGVRVVKGITTADPPFHQITTRRIVDYAKFGVRSAAEPYIGLLNNDRVRGALRATVNSFLTDMLNAEMLISYELDVTATRAEQLQGIARINMVLRPVFSIEFIRVTITLA